jgi:hypothetical protein
MHAKWRCLLSRLPNSYNQKSEAEVRKKSQRNQKKTEEEVSRSKKWSLYFMWCSYSNLIVLSLFRVTTCCSFLNSHSGGWSPNWGHSAHRPLLAYCACPGWFWGWRIWWNQDWIGKPKYSEKTCPSATLSNTNPTWPAPGANPGRRGGKSATNRLSYDSAYVLLLLLLFTAFGFAPGGSSPTLV